MSAGQGSADRDGDAGQRDAEHRDAERLAAVIEQGTPPGSVADAELARDLEIVAMLRSRATTYDPYPADRANAKARLMAALTAQNDSAQNDSAQNDSAQNDSAQNGDAPVDAAELTAPLRLVSASADQATTELARITDADLDRADAPDPATDAEAEATALHDDAPGDDADTPGLVASRTRRAGRHSLPTRPAARAGGRARSTTRPGSRGLRRRVTVVGAAALVALVTLAGAGSFFSRDALPGDALYAMKRLSESTGLAFTFDDRARAQRHLDLATTRLDEVEQMVQRGSTTAAPDVALVEAAMREFDASTSEGSRLLLASDDASGAAALGDLRAWASEQAARLSVLRSALPDPAVGEADTSIALLDRLLGRTEAIEARSSCSEVTSTITDDLGRLPAEGTCSPRVTATDDPSTAAREDGDATSTTPGGDGATDTPDPTTSGTDAPQESTTPDGVLPELGPDGLPLPSGSEGLPGRTSTGTVPDDGQVSLPLPLVPPIQLPPLGPGMPGITIG